MSSMPCHVMSWVIICNIILFIIVNSYLKMYWEVKLKEIGKERKESYESWKVIWIQTIIMEVQESEVRWRITPFIRYVSPLYNRRTFQFPFSHKALASGVHFIHLSSWMDYECLKDLSIDLYVSYWFSFALK